VGFKGLAFTGLGFKVNLVLFPRLEDFQLLFEFVGAF
jgi:hypothetical protein